MSDGRAQAAASRGMLIRCGWTHKANPDGMTATWISPAGRRMTFKEAERACEYVAIVKLDPPGRRIECREEDGGFRLVDESGREYATFSRGSNAIDVNPMSLEDAKSCLFSLGAELLRIDEQRQSVSK